MQNILQKYIFQFFSNRFVLHILLWLSVLIVFMLNQGFQKGFFFTFSHSLITVAFYIIPIYFNIFYLIPNFLTQNKFLQYSLFLILACLLITPIFGVVEFGFFSIMGEETAKQQTSSSYYIRFFSIFLFVSFSTIVTIIIDWQRNNREKKELQTQTMQSELRFLKSQINPHFLFNTLNNLYALALKKDDKAPEIVIKLSEMMRYMLYECNEKRVPLQKEINYIRNYLDLESLRQGKNIEIDFEINGRVGDQQIAPLMFIPFLENSFKHGLNNHITEGFVNIILNVDEQHVHFFIENSKPDRIPMPTKKRSGGIGLTNVRRRLDLLYPKSYELGIEDKPNSYAVNLVIDLA